MVTRNSRMLLFLLYLLFGLYFINHGIEFVKIPASFAGIDKWIVFIGGFLIVFGGINYLRASRFGY